MEKSFEINEEVSLQEESSMMMQFTTTPNPYNCTYYIFRFGDVPNTYVDTTTTPHSLHYPKLQALADLTYNYTAFQWERWIHAQCYPVNIPYPDMSYPSDEFPCIEFNLPGQSPSNGHKVWAWRDNVMQDPVWFYGGAVCVYTGSPMQLAIQAWWDLNADSTMSIATTANMTNYNNLLAERADWENPNGNGRSLFGVMNPII